MDRSASSARCASCGLHAPEYEIRLHVGAELFLEGLLDVDFGENAESLPL